MFRKLHICLSLLLPFCLFGNAIKELAPAEADAVIEKQEEAKATRKAARLAELKKSEVLSVGEGTLPDGQRVVIREVVPPALESPGVEPNASGALSETTAEQQASFEDFDRKHKVQMFSCTVYDRTVTQVRWTHEGEHYLAYTNADFNYLRGVSTLDTDTYRYSYFLGIGNASSDQTDPPLPRFSEDRSEYLLIDGNPDNAEATAGLEALLEHYDTNLDSLKVAYQRREALKAAQQRYDEQHPEKPEDFILQFWVPEKKGTP